MAKQSETGWRAPSGSQQHASSSRTPSSAPGYSEAVPTRPQPKIDAIGVLGQVGQSPCALSWLTPRPWRHKGIVQASPCNPLRPLRLGARLHNRRPLQALGQGPTPPHPPGAAAAACPSCNSMRRWSRSCSMRMPMGARSPAPLRRPPPPGRRRPWRAANSSSRRRAASVPTCGPAFQTGPAVSSGGAAFCIVSALAGALGQAPSAGRRGHGGPVFAACIL